MKEIIEASDKATRAIAAKCLENAYWKDARFVAEGAMRPLVGPAYMKLVPVVLFIISAARLHDQLGKEA